MKQFLLLFPALVLVGCAGLPPKEEMLFSKAAYEQAKKSEAVRYATQPWMEGEVLQDKAIRSFRSKDYYRARTLFVRARKKFEQAEEEALIRKKELR